VGAPQLPLRDKRVVAADWHASAVARKAVGTRTGATKPADLPLAIGDTAGQPSITFPARRRCRAIPGDGHTLAQVTPAIENSSATRPRARHVLAIRGYGAAPDDRLGAASVVRPHRDLGATKIGTA
jgi:hypothetical protein